MALAGAAAADEDDIALGLEETAAVEIAHQRLVDPGLLTNSNSPSSLASGSWSGADLVGDRAGRLPGYLAVRRSPRIC